MDITISEAARIKQKFTVGTARKIKLISRSTCSKILAYVVWAFRFKLYQNSRKTEISDIGASEYVHSIIINFPKIHAYFASFRRKW